MGQTISTAVDIACYLKAISTAKTQYWVIKTNITFTKSPIIYFKGIISQIFMVVLD